MSLLTLLSFVSFTNFRDHFLVRFCGFYVYLSKYIVVDKVVSLFTIV